MSTHTRAIVDDNTYDELPSVRLKLVELELRTLGEKVKVLEVDVKSMKAIVNKFGMIGISAGTVLATVAAELINKFL